MIRVLMTDDAELSRILRDSFFARSDTEVRLVNDGNELLRLAQETVPHWVILDARMPTPGAFAVCRELGERHLTRDVPVWIIGEPCDEQKGRRAGAVGIIPRPLDRGRILEALSARFTGSVRSSPRRSARLQVELVQDERPSIAYTKDISDKGALLRTRDTVDVGANLQVIFALPGVGGKTIRANSRVVRTLPPESDLYSLRGAAIEFTQIGARDRLALSRFVSAASEAP